MRRKKPEPLPRPPELPDYEDWRDYIQAVWDRRRAMGRLPGVGRLAEAIGLSGSHLTNVVSRRRELPVALAGDLATALGLEGKLHRLFVLKVERGAATGATRWRIVEEIRALEAELRRPRRRGRPSNAEREAWARELQGPEQERYVRTWLTNALLALLTCPRAPSDARKIARLFRRPTAPTAVKASIEDLRALGLVERVEDGRLLATASSIEAPAPISRPQFQLIHETSANIARAALLAGDPDAVVKITVLLQQPEATEIEGLDARFREVCAICEADSRSSSVTHRRPDLPPDEPRARVVLQLGLIGAPLVAGPTSAPKKVGR